MYESESSSDEEDGPPLQQVVTEEDRISLQSNSLDRNASLTKHGSGSLSSLRPEPSHHRTPSIDSVSIGSGGSPKSIVSRLSQNAGRLRGIRASNNNVSEIHMSTQSIQSTYPDDFHSAEHPEDLEHKRNLQLYVFVTRCIAYPFNAKQPTDMARRQSKVTKQNLASIKDRFSSFLEGRTSIAADEAFRNAVQSYYDSFLSCDRVYKMVNSGGYSSNDFREIFKANIEKRVRILPDIEGLSKETVLSSWMGKFDAIYRGDEDQKKSPARLAGAASELILSKDQLYEMFQTILSVKQYQHSILFNACELDNADEQAACIRRELQYRQKLLSSLSKENMPRFIHKNMEEIYIEEQKTNIKRLMSIHLEAFPVTKSGSEGKSGLYKMKRGQNNVISVMDVNDDSETVLNKAVSGLTFNLQVIVMEASGLNSLPHNRIVFVVMEVEGDEKLQTEQAEAGRPLWETRGDWTTNQPLPLLKLRLMAEHSSKLHLSDEKELAVLTKYANSGMSEASEWHAMTPYKGWNGDEIKVKLSIKMDKPQNVKKSSYMYAKGQNIWKTWKRRYFLLIQVSQYKFVLCSYREKKTSPREMMVVEGYTADFSERPDEFEGEGGRFFFNMVKAGDEVMFATEEDADRLNWIYKLYTATGQSHKPTLPSKMVVGGTADQTLQKVKGDMDRALKHGLGGIVQANPFEFNQAEMFSTLQRLTLMHRLNDSYTCLGWFSPGQVFVLDEYCARYGVRGCHRHLCYLNDLLERAENGIMIDPTLLHYSFAFCHSHVVGNRPDGVNTVTIDEKERFEEIKDRLKAYLGNQITQFRYCFPFGRPEGALKSTLTLFERVLSKDMMPSNDPEDTDDVKEAIRSCLKKAALVNYTRLSSYAKVEESVQSNSSPKDKLKVINHLAELCIELIQQNEEHHAEALAWYNELMMEHTEIFWSLFAVDMDAALDCQPVDTWDGFALFQLLNDYLRMECMYFLYSGEHAQNQQTKATVIQSALLMKEPAHFSDVVLVCVVIFEHVSYVGLLAVLLSSFILLVGSWLYYFRSVKVFSFIKPPLRNGKFHKHLSEKFSPLVVRYVDFMGSSIARSVDRGFARETYQPVGHSCATSEEIFWKLRSIQTFIQDLHWPDDDFAEHMSNRLKLMAADMTEACITRVMRDLHSMLHGSVDLDYIIPPEVCVMINVVCHAEEQAEILCTTEEIGSDEYKYHSNINELILSSKDECINLIVDKLCIVMEDLLKKMSRYDPGTITSKIFSLLKQREETADEFLQYIIKNIEQFKCLIVVDSFTFLLEQKLWERLCELLQSWLSIRQEDPLHLYQFKTISSILEPCRQLFENDGFTEKDLENENYKISYHKLKLEEAMLNISQNLTRDIEVPAYESQIQSNHSGYYGDDDDVYR